MVRRGLLIAITSLLCGIFSGCNESLAGGGQTGAIELGRSVIVCRGGAVEQQAALMLCEEIQKRSGVELEIVESLSSAGRGSIVLGTVESVGSMGYPGLEAKVFDKPEGYAIDVRGGRVYAVGSDERGAMFAAGRLIRLMNFGSGRVSLSADTDIATSPEFALRGHQLGYRSLNNAFDRWSVADYERLIRELVIFGANTIELVPSKNRNKPAGHHMKLTPWEMNIEIMKLANKYGLDIGVWRSIYMRDIETPELEAQTLADWKDFFKSIEGLDFVFVPGGDGGDLEPERMMDWLAKVDKILKEVHPDAELWLSNQTYDKRQNDVLFDYLQKEQPDWLDGMIDGPWTTISAAETRERTPKKYKFRRYPDVCHCLGCQYPVDKWDRGFSQFHGREPVCPRPVASRRIHNIYADLGSGFVTYSDGVNDDLNKFVWTCLGWDSSQSAEDICREYGKVLFGEDVADDVAAGLMSLERNWVGPIEKNEGIDKTLAIWERIYGSGDGMSDNWRAKMYLFRALYDSYLKEKHNAEQEYERATYEKLNLAGDIGVLEAIVAAESELDRVFVEKPGSAKRARIEKLGMELFEVIGYQLSVKDPYKSVGTRRGAVLDFLDRPSNNRLWLVDQFSKILAESDKAVQLAMIDRVVNWEDAGPGGFYDDLGKADAEPHLVRQVDWYDDPAFIKAVIDEQYYTSEEHRFRQSWQDQAQVRYSMGGHAGEDEPDEPKITEGRELLTMQYDRLDTKAQYRVRVTYHGRFRPVVMMVADEKYEVHGPMAQPEHTWPVEFDVPKQATADGELTLQWHLMNKARGVQVAEVWLMKK